MNIIVVGVNREKLVKSSLLSVWSIVEFALGLLSGVVTEKSKVATAPPKGKLM